MESNNLEQKIKAELEAKLPDTDIVIGSTTSIDILPKGFNKAAGLKRLLKKLGLQVATWFLLEMRYTLAATITWCLRRALKL